MRQGPTVRAVDAGAYCSGHFFLQFSLSLGRGLIETEILFQRAVKP